MSDPSTEKKAPKKSAPKKKAPKIVDGPCVYVGPTIRKHGLINGTAWRSVPRALLEKAEKWPAILDLIVPQEGLAEAVGARRTDRAGRLLIEQILNQKEV